MTEITNFTELNEIRNNLDGDYRLGADIDLSNEEDWSPFGDEENPFKGTFNGNGFKIVGLNIGPESDEVNGLFGVIDDEASLENILVEYGNTNAEVSDLLDDEEVTNEENIAVDLDGAEPHLTKADLFPGADKTHLFPLCNSCIPPFQF